VSKTLNSEGRAGRSANRKVLSIHLGIASHKRLSLFF
jgi:hypothetical protein